MKRRRLRDAAIGPASGVGEVAPEIGVAGVRDRRPSRFETNRLMIIYGTSLLAVCHLLGIVCGDLLGRALGLETNVGGVGIAMLLLISMRLWLLRHGRMTATLEIGVNYWGAIYIPVVVAMAMQQNVVAALRGGPMALLAATGSVVTCGCLISVINRAEGRHPGPSGPVVPAEAT